MPAVAATPAPSNSPSERSSSAMGEGSSTYGPVASCPKVVLMARMNRGHSSADTGRSWSARSVTVGVYRAGTTIRQPVVLRSRSGGDPVAVQGELAAGDRLDLLLPHLVARRHGGGGAGAGDRAVELDDRLLHLRLGVRRRRRLQQQAEQVTDPVTVAVRAAHPGAE